MIPYGHYSNSTVQEYGGDLSRPTKFSVTIGLPEVAKNIDFPNSNKIPPKFDALLKSVNIPSVTNETIDVKYKGHNIKVPGKVNYEQTVTVTLYLDEEHNIPEYFYSWMKAMDETQIGSDAKIDKSFFRAPLNYTGNLKINALNFDEVFKMEIYEFHNVFPISVNGVQFDSNSPSSVGEVTVEFAYLHFEAKSVGNALHNILNKAKNAAGEALGDLLGLNSDEREVASHMIPATIDFFRKAKGM